MPNFTILKAADHRHRRSRARAAGSSYPTIRSFPYIEGDGTGPDIWRASVRVFDAAVAEGVRRQEADRVVRSAGRREGQEQYGEWLPNDTLEAVRAYKVAIKGPLTTPVGGGIRSLNVTLRQVLDLYACVRPGPLLRGHARRRSSTPSGWTW